MKSLRRDLRASLAWDFRANGAQWEKLLELLLVEFDDERFDGSSEKFEVIFRYCLLIGRENSVPSGVAIFCTRRKKLKPRKFFI